MDPRIGFLFKHYIQFVNSILIRHYLLLYQTLLLYSFLHTTQTNKNLDHDHNKTLSISTTTAIFLPQVCNARRSSSSSKNTQIQHLALQTHGLVLLQTGILPCIPKFLQWLDIYYLNELLLKTFPGGIFIPQPLTQSCLTFHPKFIPCRPKDFVINRIQGDNVPLELLDVSASHPLSTDLPPQM